MNISEPHLRRAPSSSEEAPPESGSHLERTRAPEAELAGALHEVSNALTVVLGWLATVRGEPLAPHVREALDVAEQHARRGHRVARSAIGADVTAGEREPDAASIGRRTRLKGEVAKRSGVERVHGAAHAVQRGVFKAFEGQPSDDETDAELRLRNVSSLVHDVATAVRPVALERGVTLETSLGDGGVGEGGAAGDLMVSGGDALLQVLVNLTMNAIAFSPVQGVVRIGARADANKVVFTVADQGPGVPQAQRRHLFERGQSMRPGGAGIGLSHSRSLAAQNAGSLNLVNNQGGATFEVTWPTRELPSQTICKAPFLRGTKVLVLEDDEAVMDMVRFGLESRGAQVFHAATLTEVGLLTSVHRDFTLALLDLSPIDGRYEQAAQQLRRSQAALPLILMSGSVNAGQAQLDAAAWVKKPFELSELYDTLQSVLANCDALSAKRS